MLNPFRFIEFNARAYPGRVALDDGATVLNFSQLAGLARRIAARLAGRGVNSGQLVLTCLPPGLDWVFTQALFHEACITCSNHGYAEVDSALGVDWIISDKPQPHFPADKLILIDKAWLGALDQEVAAERPREYASEDALCRLVLTSGTTGHAKAVAYSVARLDTRLRTTSSYWSVARGEMNLMVISTLGGFMTALSAALTGDAYFAPNPQSNLKTLRKYAIRSLIGSPVQLARLLDEIRLSREPLTSVKEIRSAGGALSPVLIAALRQYFAAEIFNVYGATEVGGVAFCAVTNTYDPSMAGFLLHGAAVELVDEQGAAVPAGEEGLVRIRSGSMATGYYRNPEASAATFRDGWFYPGDRGRLAGNGMLLLAGRNSELINRGGIKIDPAAIDQYLLAYPGIEDAAAFGLEDASGVQELAVALIAAPTFSLEQLRADMLARFGTARSARYWFRVQGIPRNEMGKVMRAQMSRFFAAQVLAGQAERVPGA